MKVSTENDNNVGYEKITILVDNIPLRGEIDDNFFCFVSKLSLISANIVNTHFLYMSTVQVLSSTLNQV
jgi:hypothetical protein